MQLTLSFVEDRVLLFQENDFLRGQFFCLSSYYKVFGNIEVRFYFLEL